MNPWITDANEMAPSQVSVFKTNLLHPTRAITRFLEHDNTTSTIVVAPKGFGKTLLLKAKRLSLTDRSIKIIPSDNLLDKPSGSPSVMSGRDYSDIRDNPSYWKTLWIITFSVAILKSEKIQISGLSKFGDRVYKSLKKSPCDIFDSLISCSYAEYQSILLDFNNIILILIREVHHPVIIFVDNIDEYYEDMLSAQSHQSGLNLFGGAKEAHWYLVQLGVALAARELSQINNHLRIYSSIRREVVQRSVTSSAFGLQLMSRSIVIEYPHSDLISMIVKNIDHENANNLVLRRDPDPISKFIGKDNRYVFHPKTGDQEPFEDFWIRHTLGRPRELMMIGEAISCIDPADRKLRRLREVIREKSGEFASAYMTEMSSHLPGFVPTIITKLIPKNTLTINELAVISHEYNQEYNKRFSDSEAGASHVFCALYKIGLLGYVGNDFETGGRIQIFNRPGSVALDETGILPEADIYLLHPALDSLIASSRPKYFTQLNPLNIIGAGRPWRDKRAVSYVLKGDLKAFSQIMKDTIKGKKFIELLNATLREYSTQIDYCEIEQGDAVTIVDGNPISVVTVARQIESAIAASEFKGSFRFGGEAGYVLIDSVEKLGGNVKSVSGIALRTAARLEPHVRPGEIWVTEEFVRHLSDQFTSGVYRFVSVDPSEIGLASVDDGKVDLAKGPQDETLLTRIYRVMPL